MATTSLHVQAVATIPTPGYLFHAASRYQNEWIAAGERHILAHSTDADEVTRIADATGLPYILVFIGWKEDA